MADGSTHVDRWIADRMTLIESSGIRKVMELGRSLKNPVNLSIGQPDFDVPEPVRRAAHEAIEQSRNGYTVTQGIAELRERILTDVRQRFPQDPQRALTITSGTSGGLVLALSCTVNPGDEVIIFDPFFVSYPHLIALAGGTPVYVDTYPTCTIDAERVRSVITPRTKAIMVNSPSNPCGVLHSRESLRDLALLAQRHNLLLISDEVYSVFTYDAPPCSPAEFNPDVLVVDGFSKSYGMTGWRLGFAHGPQRLIEEMNKLQQFTFVCAPSMVQHAGLAAWDHDTRAFVTRYQGKRDRLLQGLNDQFEIVRPGGAFYVFPRAPWGTGTEFVEEAVRNNLLLIPGKVFSRSDTHFRISYAADDETIDRGVEILNRLARKK
jgi:aspartate/methionine/tyrosine aminotransferase